MVDVDLFSSDRAVLQRRAYTDQEIFDVEMDRIFGRCWVFVGHVSQIPKPNDFVTSRMGNDRVVLTRDAQGSIHVLLNTCRHKGMRVVRYDVGNTRTFACPYHDWVYSTSGSLTEVPGQLVAVQRAKEAYGGPEFDKRCWGLVNARVGIYHGAVFATWDHSAPDLEDYLGDMKLYLNVLLDSHTGEPEGTELVGGILKWRVKANWKTGSENAVGDGLHGVSHKSVEVAQIGPGGRGGQTRHGVDAAAANTHSIGDVAFPRFGHGVLGSEPYIVDDDTPDLFPKFTSPVGPLDDPAVAEDWFRRAAVERRERLRGQSDVLSSVFVGGVFPNMGFHPVFPRTIVVYHPVSPTMTEAWRYCVVEKDAPAQVKALVRHHVMRYSGPAGMTEQDDMENWSYLTEAATGTQAQRYPYNDQARKFGERPSAKLRDAVVTDSVWSEAAIRGYYSCWNRHLISGSWADYFDNMDREVPPGATNPVPPHPEYAGGENDGE